MMATNDEQHYGAWIRDARRRRGLELEEISEVIRIDVPYLRALESGNIAVLPEPYMRAFLKTYVTYIGLDHREALERFDAFVREQEEHLEDVRAAVREKEGRRLPDGSRIDPAAVPDPGTEAASGGSGGRWLIAAVVVVLIAGAAYLAVQLTRDMDMESPAADPVRSEEARLDIDPDASAGETVPTQPPGSLAGRPADTSAAIQPPGPSGTEEPPTPERSQPAPVRSHLLVVDATEATWIQAVADGDTIVSRIMPAGGSIRIPFADSLLVRAGKNWSLQMTLDGREVVGLGPEGYVLSSLVLTGDGIVSRRLSLPPDEPPPLP
jgi:transcriptional regulator with XRE-family HTH domain